MSDTPPPAPASAAPGLRRWYLGSMNDGLFIIDKPPRPSTDDVWHDRPDGPDMAIPVSKLGDKWAKAIVDAHNAALAEQQAAARPAPGVDVKRLRALVAKATPGPWRKHKAEGYICGSASDYAQMHVPIPADLELILAMHEALPALLAPADGAVTQGWRPIETALRDGTKVDLYFPIKGLGRITDCWWDSDQSACTPGWVRMGDDGEIGGYVNAAPTHWMPTPAPPAALPADEGERT